MLLSNLNKFNKVVLWGYKDRFHSHQFIHLGYAQMLNKLNIKYIWVDDNEESNSYIEKNDLIMIPDVHLTEAGKKTLCHNFRKDVYYILHPGDFLSEQQVSSMDKNKVVKLYEYRNSHLRKLRTLGYEFEELDNFIFCDKTSKVILQPWGSDLEYDDFLAPVYPNSNVAYFIGSIWGDSQGLKNGNMAKIEYIKDMLIKNGIDFISKTKLTTEENIKYIRESRISFSIGAIFHNEDNYLQCRMFKNIAYGQPTITDVIGFEKILGDSFITFDDWQIGIEKILSLSPEEYKQLCIKQQNRIRNYTYRNMWKNILSLFNL